MAKIIVNLNELKGFSFYRNYIEKAKKGEMVGGKYMYREEVPEKVKTSKGKTTVIRYKYYYLTDMLKDSAEKLLENIGKFFFKGNEKEVKKIENSYKTQNIEKDYGADKKTWYQHCMEYLSHKAKWDKRFSNKDNAEKFKTPIKQKVVEKVDIPGMETAAEETPEIKTTIETEKKEATWKPNPSLMRKVWSLYNGVESVNNGVSVGDIVNFNGRKGTVTKKVNDNMVMVSFEDGGLGRFFAKDLNKVEISNESVTNEADVNGKIQEVVTGLNTSNDTVEETTDGQGNKIAMLGNQNAKKNFVDFIDKFITNGYKSDKVVNLLDTTPLILQEHGIPNNPISITPSVLKKILENDLNVYHGHNISVDILKDLPNQLENPVYILKGKDGKKIIVTEYYVENRPIITILEIDRKEGRTNVNSVRSLYDKQNTVFMEWIKDDSIVEYENKEKSKVLLQSIGNQYTKEVTTPYINNNTTNIENVNSEHGNSIAMLGNDNAKKDFVDVKQGFSEMDKKLLALALYKEKEFNPTMNDYYYYEKLRYKYPNLASKGSIYSIMEELKGIDVKNINLDEVKEYVEKIKGGGDEPPKNDAKKNFVDGLSLDTELIANANNSSYMYEAGDAINREYLGGIEAINSWDLTDEEKQKAKQKLFELTTEQLKAQAKAISVTVAGPARKVSGSDTAFDKVQKIRGKIKELLDTIRAKNNTNVQKQEMKDFTTAATEAMNNNKLAFVYDGKVYYRGNIKSSSWSEINHIPEVDETKTVDEKKKELKKLKEESKNLGFANPENTKTLDRIEKLKNEIAYMNTDEWQNRHNAMLGNQNAAKPFSEEETKKEQKKVKETREKAGLPKIGINYGERVSAMEDSVSLNPNAENYAYKDTGYIAGSQKEKIQDFWKRKKESGEGTSIEEIDWNTLEENPRYAEQQITKSNILGNIDYNSFKEKGMDSRAAYLASRVFAAIPKEPTGHDVTARKNYVIAINTVKERLSGCKTLYDVKEFVDDVYGEYKQTFDSQILRVPEVNKLTQERDDIIKEKKKIRESVMGWCRNELVPKYKALGKKERKAFWRYREELKKEISEKIREFDPNYNNPNIDIEIDTSNMWWPVNVSSAGILQEKIDKANNKLKTARENAKNIIMNNNVTYEVWKELGDFADLRYSKTFQKHYNNLTVYDEKQATEPNGEIYEPYAYKYRDKEYDKYENWDWVNKKTNKKAKPESEIIEGKVKRTFEMIVPETIERVGGRNVSVKSTEELKKAFNFRDIQTGSYVQSDPVSAKWHIDNLASGFADLCDVLGIRDDQVSLNGRLALAVGARGHGKALAHYEPVERVINITKFKGGGSLGHEWFHSFDNMIAEAITGGNVSVYMSDPRAASKKYRLHDDIPDNELAHNVRNKFINLVDAMMTGDTPETEVITYKSIDVETAKKFFEKDLPFQAAYYSYGNDFYKKLANAKTLDDAISVINERYKDTINLIHNNSEKISRMGKYEQKRMKDTVKNYEKYRTMAVAYFDTKADKSNGGEVSVKTGRIVSRFYEDSKKLDIGRSKKYWSEPVEMAARAFEAYLVDKLKEKGQKNDYLSGHADNTVYLGEWFPYPTEKDRVKINKAFDELFEVIRNENAIRKSLDILKNREEIKKSLPLFFIKNGRFYIRKS